MAYKALMYGLDDLYMNLKSVYAREVKRGNLEIVADAIFEGEGIRFIPYRNNGGGG